MTKAEMLLTTIKNYINDGNTGLEPIAQAIDKYFEFNVELRDGIVRWFSKSEIRRICFDFSLNADEYGTTPSEIAEGLVKNVDNQTLKTHLKGYRNHVNW